MLADEGTTTVLALGAPPPVLADVHTATVLAVAAWSSVLADGPTFLFFPAFEFFFN